MKIGFIGAGKVGKALGLYFQAHGIEVTGYYSKHFDSARKAAELTETTAFETIKELAKTCEVLFITTPDHVIADIDGQASELLNKKLVDLQKTWIHVSGAYASDCLTGIKAAGCPVGSMHPLQSFGEPDISAEQLETTFFSIEGTWGALDVIQNILDTTGGRFNKISAERKPLYHAGACVLSNYLVTLIDSGMRYLEASGMDRSTLFQAVEPLIVSTLNNISDKDTVEALTGPIVRGDFDTVSLHLETIKKKLPSELELYRVMALKTAAMIHEKKMTQEQGITFKRLMKGSGSNG